MSCPAPAPRVSTIKRLWNIARIPCSIPGPDTRTLEASGAPDTFRTKGLPVDRIPCVNNAQTQKSLCRFSFSSSTVTNQYQLSRLLVMFWVQKLPGTCSPPYLIWSTWRPASCGLTLRVNVPSRWSYSSQ